jgi:hypothetical protein
MLRQAGSTIGNGQTFFPMRCSSANNAKPWCLVIRNIRSNIRAFERHEDVGLENQESWELLWNN